MPSTRFLPNVHPVINDLALLIRHLRIVKSRLPFLLAVKAEGDKLLAAGGRLKNDAALQLFKDCYDMLVIDLNSIRSQAISQFKQLHQQRRNLLRHVRVKDIDATLDEGFREETARWCNERFDALFPDGEPSKDKAKLDGMIQRFRDATEPTRRDRNWTRAHRFGPVSEDAKAAFQTLEQVESQVAVFNDFLGKVFVALTGSSYDIEPVAFSWDWKTTARDLADLIVVGSIQDAIDRYGGTGAGGDGFFWFRRERFYADGGRPE